MSEPVTREDFQTFADAVLYELRIANWQRAGGKPADKPRPPAPRITTDELAERRAAQSEHLQRRRQERAIEDAITQGVALAQKIMGWNAPAANTYRFYSQNLDDMFRRYQERKDGTA